MTAHKGVSDCEGVAWAASVVPYVLLGILYIIWLFVVVRLCEVPFRIEWESAHLIDRAYLENSPGVGLLYLHSQPPNLNVLATVVLLIGKWWNVEPSSVAFAVFAVFGISSVVLVYELAHAISGRRSVGFGSVCIVLCNPGFAYFHQLFFYEFPVLCAILLSLFIGFLYVRRRSPQLLWLLTLSLVCLSLWKALLHPLLMIGVFGSVVGGAELVHRGGVRRRYSVLWATLFLVLGLAVWPLKNWIVFGQFANSSWTAFNLSNRFPSPFNDQLATFIGSGQLTPQMQERLKKMSMEWPPVAAKLVTEAFKPSTGAINWNNAIFVVTAPEIKKGFLLWMRNHFGQWLRVCVGQYFMATRATFIFPYSAEVWGVGNGVFYQWELAYRDYVFFDLRPCIESSFPDWWLHKSAMTRDQKVPYSLFSVVFPLLMIAVVWKVVRSVVNCSELDVLAACMCLLLMWSVLVPSISDGAEANRMRFATSPLVLLLLLYVAFPRPTNGRLPLNIVE